jgi:type IV pilus assembly protein PilZ
MRLPITVTIRHKGKALEIDSQREVISLLGPRGERIGTLPWEAVIDQILTTSEAARVPESRTQPRIALVAKVRYNTPGGKRLESNAVGIGLGGMFIESSTPHSVGTQLEVEFALPDRPDIWLAVKGTVAWVCPKADQYTLSPGMGIRFAEISDSVRERLMELVNVSKWVGR